MLLTMRSVHPTRELQGARPSAPGEQEALALTPQQERTLEAHQALFEQQAAAVEEGKAVVLAALADAAKQDDPEAALQLLQVGNGGADPRATGTRVLLPALSGRLLPC